MPVDIVKPVLKWVGGKNQIIREILDTFPTEITDYHEPFLGGGSVLLALLSYREAGKISVSGTVYASDLNENLVHTYKNLQTKCDKVIEELDKLVEAFEKCKGTVVHRKPKTLEEAATSQESYYYWTRTAYNDTTREERNSPKGTAMFLFLNKTCFRGVYREGPKGFNVAFGHYNKPTVFVRDHLIRVSELVRGVVFRCAKFDESLMDVRPSSFVYLDPPYAPVSRTSFVGYTEDGFDEGKHKQLFGLCNALADGGVYLVMSNADVPFVRNNFPEDRYLTRRISCRRAIDSKNPASRANEIVIQSFRPQGPAKGVKRFLDMGI